MINHFYAHRRRLKHSEPDAFAYERRDAQTALANNRVT
jgi:hypothetical protein